MLSVKQQKLLFKLYVNGKLTRKDCLYLFSNDSDFFHQIKPILNIGIIDEKENNGIVGKEKDENERVEYTLTLAGKWFFEVFISKFDDEFKKYRKDARLICIKE